MPLIHVENVEKSFQHVNVIKGINFKLENGKCVALIGANGAGKTTILRMMSGLMQPSSGRIYFEGQMKGEDIRKHIGYLPQHPVFYEWMTAEEFLQYVGKLSGLDAKLAKSRCNELLNLVGLEDARKRKIGQFSGGMKQRLGIAQAIIHKPKLIMLDEPVSALDPFGRREVLELLEQLKKESTILFSTHILNDAEEVSEEILFLHNGELIESGTMDEFREKYHQAKIDLVFSRNAEGYLAAIPNHQSILSIKYEGNKASIYVSDLEAAKNFILEMTLKKQWPIQKFEISSVSLEDVFMKVVKK